MDVSSAQIGTFGGMALWKKYTLAFQEKEQLSSQGFEGHVKKTTGNSYNGQVALSVEAESGSTLPNAEAHPRLQPCLGRRRLGPPATNLLL